VSFAWPVISGNRGSCRLTPGSISVQNEGRIDVQTENEAARRTNAKWRYKKKNSGWGSSACRSLLCPDSLLTVNFAGNFQNARN
jgi:hypothetical protein